MRCVRLACVQLCLHPAPGCRQAAACPPNWVATRLLCVPPFPLVCPTSINTPWGMREREPAEAATCCIVFPVKRSGIAVPWKHSVCEAATPPCSYTGPHISLLTSVCTLQCVTPGIVGVQTVKPSSSRIAWIKQITTLPTISSLCTEQQCR
jgi:hypothetical protein